MPVNMECLQGILTPGFNTSKTDEIEIGMRLLAFPGSKNDGRQCETAHIAMQNRPFCIAICAVSGCNESRLARQNRPFWGLFWPIC